MGGGGALAYGDDWRALCETTAVAGGVAMPEPPALVLASDVLYTEEAVAPLAGLRNRLSHWPRHC